MSDTVQAETKAPRELSTVQFPYSDLDEATAVARAIQQSGGMPMERDQIAAKMGQKATSGAFISKLSAARMFGLTEPVPGTGKIRITQLGHEAIDTDEARQRGAKAEAFLNVELYAKLHDEFRGRQLPPRPLGLEQAMVALGVAAKQRTNARYAFDRSAKQAGFFEHGSDKLVAPVGAPSQPHKEPADERPREAGFVAERQLDEVIKAMIGKIPTEGPWPGGDRAVWLTMMSMAFDLAFGRSGEITVSHKATPNTDTPEPRPIGPDGSRAY